MFRRTILSLSIAAATAASAQTQMPNAVKIGTDGITITSAPANAVFQVGTNQGPGVWSTPMSIPTGQLPLFMYCCTVLTNGVDVDPDYLKETDVQQQATAFTVGYNDTSGNPQVVQIPALTPPATSTSSSSSGSSTSASVVFTVTPGTVVPLTFSNVTALTGSPAVPVLSLFGVQAFTLVGGVLSNFNWNMTINGTTLNCTFGALSATNGTASVNCIAPTTNTQ